MSTIQTKVQITGDATGAKKAMADVQRSMTDMTNKARNMGNVIKGATRPDSIADMGMYLGKLGEQAKTATGSLSAMSSLAASFGGPWGIALAAVTAALAALADKFDWFGDKVQKQAEERAKKYREVWKKELDQIVTDDIGRLKADNKELFDAQIQLRLDEEAYKEAHTKLLDFKKNFKAMNDNQLEIKARNSKTIWGAEEAEKKYQAWKAVQNKLYNELIQADRRLEKTFTESSDKVKKLSAKETKPTTSSKSAAIVEGPAVGSIAYFESKVAEATKMYKNAISAEEREIYQQDIKFFSDIIDTINGKTIEIHVDNKELEDTLELVDTSFEDISNKSMATVSSVIGSAADSLGSFADESKKAAQAQKALAIAEQVAALASAVATASESGDPYTVAARIAAASAAVVAAFAQASKFADGGIVGGNSHNDGILARVSSGEMILNHNEQANLFRMLKNGTTDNAGADVNFVITGDSLQGTLKNRSRSINRLR